MNPKISDYRPRKDWVLVMEWESCRRSRSGLYLVEPRQPELAEARVRRVGPTCRDLKVADEGKTQVLIPARQGVRMEEDAAFYRHVKEEDILAEVLNVAGEQEVPFSERVERVFGRWVLAEWEEAKDTIMGGRLLRGHVGKKAHFTGHVLKAGPEAGEVEPGKRYFFEQFSEFRYWEEGSRRFAFLPVEAIYCEIPPRTEEVCLADSEVANPAFEKEMSRMIG